ncbi:MAG TPA: OmpA family protein [Gemmatimonadales bacterium]|jgi:peptidoglycan-associated lipoprotein|nr:OmpA family protein [Gemmatimonadales bacterium]
MRRATPIILGIVVLVIAAACGGNPPPPPPEPNADSLAALERERLAREQAVRDSIERARREAEERIRRAAEDSLAALRRTTEEVRGMLAAMINFDYDRSDIRPGDAQILDQKLAILNANPNLQVEIVGHCDERGSDEYNLALGNRRALAAKQYLVSRGIEAGRIATRSMGEEQPLNPASDESAWAQNRRDEFSITAGGDMLMRPPGM